MNLCVFDKITINRKTDNVYVGFLDLCDQKKGEDDHQANSICVVLPSAQEKLTERSLGTLGSRQVSNWSRCFYLEAPRG